MHEASLNTTNLLFVSCRESTAMAIDLQAGGHRFDFITGLCMRCKMPLKKFEDSGRPQCTGQSPDRWKVFRNPDDDPSGAA
jgi:hypothetical protein